MPEEKDRGITWIPFTVREAEQNPSANSGSGVLPRHPGALLKAKMATLALSPGRLSRLIGVQRSRLERIAAETHPLRVDTAMRLAKYFGGQAEEWLDLQTRYDLAVARKDPEMTQILQQIPSIKSI